MKVQPISYKQVKEKLLQDEETKQLYFTENELMNSNLYSNKCVPVRT
ncbi:hypothetical protein [Haemophilus parahaemolyticus]|nr:hypothetical protein [Haemophilus parahaemolyticus]